MCELNALDLNFAEHSDPNHSQINFFTFNFILVRFRFNFVVFHFFFRYRLLCLIDFIEHLAVAQENMIFICRRKLMPNTCAALLSQATANRIIYDPIKWRNTDMQMKYSGVAMGFQWWESAHHHAQHNFDFGRRINLFPFHEPASLPRILENDRA